MLAEEPVEVDRLGDVAADLEVGGGVGVARVLVGADDQGRGVDAGGAQLAQGVDARTCAASSRRAGAGRAARRRRVHASTTSWPSAAVSTSWPSISSRVRSSSRIVSESSATRILAISLPPPSRLALRLGRRAAIGSRTLKVEPWPGGRLGADRAAVQLDQRFRDRQAEAGAADPLGQPGVAAGEALEDVLQLVCSGCPVRCRSPRSPPRHRRRRAATWIDAPSGEYSCALVSRFTRTWRIRSGSTSIGGRPGCDLLGQRLAGGLGLAAHRPHGVVDQRRDLGRRRLDRQPAGVAAGEVEQVVEQAHQVAACCRG